MKIAFVSIGTGGTMGHMSLTTTLAESLSRNSFNKVIIFSEDNYHQFSNSSNKKIIYIKLPKQKHMQTVAGSLNYRYKKKILNELESKNIKVIIFSTFFDREIAEYARKKGVKCFLISYPLRDSHRTAFLARKYYEIFDRIFTLNDITPLKRMYPNEIIVSPLMPKLLTRNSGEPNRVLITCGGGGRPSSDIFFTKIKKVVSKIKRIHPQTQFTFVIGKSKTHIHIKGTKVITWSNKFHHLLQEHDQVISEAGYFTMLDLISARKPSIVIPGERRIDNQELRAIQFQKEGLGKCIFPNENESVLVNSYEELLQKNVKKYRLAFLKTYKHLTKHKPIDKAIMKELYSKNSS